MTAKRDYPPVYLFTLLDGTKVYKGDVLYHPDRRKVGWCCFAKFKPNGDMVTVRSDNGAVPTVRISELLKEPRELKWCRTCGQRIK